MNSGIYKIYNIITNDCYIGSSYDLTKRKQRHSRDLKANKHHSLILQRAVNKYGINNFRFKILELCVVDDLLNKEQYYIDTFFPKYNICRYAGSSLGVKQSEESKAKKRKYALDNNIIPPESTWKDKQLTVYKLDKITLEVIDKYESLASACRSVGKDSTFVTTIKSCCENKRFSAYGYRWVLNLDDIIKLREKKPLNHNKGKNINKPGRPILQYSIKNEFIKEWKSIKEAELVYGKGISNCARGVSNSSNGYKWKYKIKDNA